MLPGNQMKRNTDYARDAMGIYTAKNLQEKLQKVRGRNVPIDTLKYWRHQLGIEPDSHRLYTQSDLEILRALVRWLQAGGKIPQFVNLLKQRMQKHGS
jgi:DNA-binding transcriptional MerR regulator